MLLSITRLLFFGARWGLELIGLFIVIALGVSPAVVLFWGLGVAVELLAMRRRQRQALRNDSVDVKGGQRWSASSL